MNLKLGNVSILLIILFFVIGCADNKVEVHHLYPQEFRGFFASKGINVDEYGINLTKELHRAAGEKSLHGSKWNQEWREYLINNKNASKSNLENQLLLMLAKRDISGRINYIDYRTKQQTGVYIDVFGSGIIGWLGSFGNLIIKLFGASSSITVFFIWVGSAVLSILGFSTRQEAGFLVGVGFFVTFIILCITIWVIYPFLYAWLVGIGVIGVLGVATAEQGG